MNARSMSSKVSALVKARTASALVQTGLRAVQQPGVALEVVPLREGHIAVVASERALLLMDATHVRRQVPLEPEASWTVCALVRALPVVYGRLVVRLMSATLEGRRAPRARERPVARPPTTPSASTAGDRLLHGDRGGRGRKGAHKVRGDIRWVSRVKLTNQDVVRDRNGVTLQISLLKRVGDLRAIKGGHHGEMQRQR